MKLPFSGFVVFFSLISVSTLAIDPIKSDVFYWEKTGAVKTKSGECRQFLTGNTNQLDYLDVHATTLNPGKSVAGTDNQARYEKLIIVKDGEILQTLNGEKKLLKSGCVVLLLAGEKLKLENQGNKPASYFMLQWENSDKKIQKNIVGKLTSEIRAWEDVIFTATEKGGSRKFFKRPTNFLYEFEMHVTTLLEGINSHAPHSHPDDEIILVKSGTVEELINGKHYPYGAGSFVFLLGNDSHGLTNIGKGPCEYYAFRFLKEAPVK
jgi:(S)-ureidoglycine aminohydrolase